MSMEDVHRELENAKAKYTQGREAAYSGREAASELVYMLAAARLAIVEILGKNWSGVLERMHAAITETQESNEAGHTHLAAAVEGATSNIHLIEASQGSGVLSNYFKLGEHNHTTFTDTEERLSAWLSAFIALGKETGILYNHAGATESDFDQAIRSDQRVIDQITAYQEEQNG
jgi:hypothetical protein